jgi:hypothetical protein
MLKQWFSIIAAYILVSCHHVDNKAKQMLHQTGETAGKVGGEIVNSVNEGVKQSMQCQVQLATGLSSKGIQTGKLSFASNGGTDNVLRLYLIFNEAFTGRLSIRVTDEKGLEYGRTALDIKAIKGSAGFYDFVFDTRTNLEGKSTFIVQ